MGINIDIAAASQIFDTMLTIKYQNDRKLQNTIEERHGTVGTTLNVPVSDLVEMQEGSFAPTDIPITPVNETNRAVPTNDYHLKTVIGGGEKTLFNFDKITDHAKLHALASARLDDFIKINAIFSDPNVGTIYTVPVTVGVNTGLNEGKMADGLSYLESQGVDVMDHMVSMWASALLRKSLYNDQQVTNFFFNDTKPLVNNRLESYLGTDIRFLGENGINKIPSTDIGGGISQYLIPLVHKDAIVQSYNRDISTSITWVPQQDRWEILTTITSGALIIQYNGIAFLTANNPFAANP